MASFLEGWFARLFNAAGVTLIVIGTAPLLKVLFAHLGMTGAAQMVAA